MATASEVREAFVVGLGSPDWRELLFDGWNFLRLAVNDFVPTARWWLWGCFVSSHPTPLHGDRETLIAVVTLPVADLPDEQHEFLMVLSLLQGAQESYHVDVGVVFDAGSGDPEAEAALERKYRPRATMGVPDHRTGELAG